MCKYTLTTFWSAPAEPGETDEGYFYLYYGMSRHVMLNVVVTFRVMKSPELNVERRNVHVFREASICDTVERWQVGKKVVLAGCCGENT